MSMTRTMHRWIQCLFFLPCITLLTASNNVYPFACQRRALRSWGILVRGGEQQQTSSSSSSLHRSVVAVGLVRGGIPSVMFYYAGHEYDNNNKKKNKHKVYTTPPLSIDMVETLAITSDVMLVTIDPTQPHQPWGTTTTTTNNNNNNNTTHDVMTSIVRGAKRKQEGGYSKLAVLVVLTGTFTQEEAGSWKDRIVMQCLGEMTPSLMESLDIVTEDEAPHVYQHVMQSLRGESMVTNHDEYSRLTQQVYEALTSKTCPDEGLSFQPATAALFQTSNTNIHTLATTNIEDETRTPTQDNLSGIDQSMLQSAMKDLERLESQQDEVWLNADSQVPILHFGSAANAVLEKASKALEHSHHRSEILNHMATKIQGLYQNQLQSLREHFGRKYEAALEEYAHDNEQALTDAAARITQGFRTAAQHAIPNSCREGQELVDTNFSYVSALRGLLSDMMEATTMHQPDDDNDDNNEEEDGVEPPKAKQPANWYQKLAARALMLGINYAQGWLAWQGVRKAAAKRDKDMPKFPLF